MSTKFADALVSEGVITPQQIKEALDYQRANGGRLTEILINLGLLTDHKITAALSRQYGIPSVDLNHFEIDPLALSVITREVAKRYNILPLSRVGATLTLAMADPTDVFAIDDVKFMTGLSVEPVVVSETGIASAIDKYFPRETEAALEIDDVIAGSSSDIGYRENGESLEILEEETELDLVTLVSTSDDSPVVKLVNVILIEALQRGASEIHIEPYENSLRVRMRIDGILCTVLEPPSKLRGSLTSRLKIMAKLDISEKRLPQDGRMILRLRIHDRPREVEFRVSTFPMVSGENIVLRILDKASLRVDLEQLGLEPENLEKLKRNLLKRSGLVLVTGPTGSGKTNTIYSAMSHINSPELKIMTAEDPVEYLVPGLNQAQIRENIGLTYASALRSFLRQNADVIMVGELRDFETTDIAVKAALTGHLVLSTLHTNDATSTIDRLINTGIEPLLVATAVNLIQAQRLVRRICAKCKVEVQIPTYTLIGAGFSPEEAELIKVFRGAGCPVCNNTGYQGRTGLFELFEMSDPTRELILTGASGADLRQKAITEGMMTLRGSGLEKIRQGLTTVEEVLRETAK